MTASPPIILAALLFGLASVMLFMSLRIGYQVAYRVQEGPRRGSRLRDLSSRLLVRRGEKAWKRYQELSSSLRRAGYVGLRTHIVVILMVSALIFASAITAMILWQVFSADSRGTAQIGLATGAVTAALLWLMLQARIRGRAKRMEENIEVLLQVTRMLWSTGMTLEMQFQRLVVHLADMAPDITFELSVALRRIESGQPREDVLEQLATYQPYSGLADYFRLLAQLSVSGGRALQSFQVMSELLRDNRRTRLQELLSKMSARMSLVMMLCFFPALLIFMAGPALVNMAGMFETLNR